MTTPLKSFVKKGGGVFHRNLSTARLNPYHVVFTNVSRWIGSSQAQISSKRAIRNTSNSCDMCGGSGDRVRGILSVGCTHNFDILVTGILDIIIVLIKTKIKKSLLNNIVGMSHQR